MKRILLIVLIAVFASSTLALAAWKVADMVNGDEAAPPSGAETALSDDGAGEAGSGETAGEAAQAASGDIEAAGAEAAARPSGEDFSQDTPEQRYVTETQRHQNFFVALAEGEVKRLDAIATDYQPAGDPDTSYMYFTVTTTGGGKHDGTMVLKHEDGLWRIAAVRQLTGGLGGGTDYVVPADFEADLARELVELQDFLSKTAQGRLDYMVVDSVSRPSDTETVLIGRVVSVGGRIVDTQHDPAQRLRYLAPDRHREPLRPESIRRDGHEHQ